MFDVCGQQPHDVVPGAFIAKKAGAVLKDLAGQEITFERLEELLMKPNSAEMNLTYVLACTNELCDAVIATLAPKEEQKALAS